MNIDWIETYLDLLETRSFHATAENLALTQSTVSHRIAKLEESLGALTPAHYTFPNISPAFTQLHQQQLPQLSHALLAG